MRSGFEMPSPAERTGTGVAIGLGALALCVGAYTRFSGLEAPPLGTDEYYFVTSVQHILERGLPEYPTGGYYVRALPHQYLIAASTLLLGENGFAYRLPSVLCGLGSIALAYVLERLGQDP